MTTDDKSFIDKAINGLTVRILWICLTSIVLASVGATAWYYTLIGNIEKIVTDNRIQQISIDRNSGDIHDLQAEIRYKADKSEVDNLSNKLDDYARYVNNRPLRR